MRNGVSLWRQPVIEQAGAAKHVLGELQQQVFHYFLEESNPENGLVVDKTEDDWPASIAAVGLALASYPVGVERGFITREEAIERVRCTLSFFWNSPQGTAPDATGYKGFYYHFLDMRTGRRAWRSELSTIDTALLIAGVLVVATYFERDSEAEQEIRTLADALYRRVDWRWAQNGGATLTHGWRPESGFLPYRWTGYNEALLLYVLALGSPTFALAPESYRAWSASYVWKKIYGWEFLYAGPLFIHQLSHVWIDFRDIVDDFMHAHESNYFENSRRATYIQQHYAMRNPRGFRGYGKDCWGFSASDGPGNLSVSIDGVKRRFYDYKARGVPYGPDDGTISPWAVVASLPFAPEIVLPAIDSFDRMQLRIDNPYGYKATFNATFPNEDGSYGWTSPYHVGINQGPIVLMIENYRTELIWRLMRGCTYISTGLRQAGFHGGWLEG